MARGNAWPAAKLARLFHLRDELRLPWATIGEAMGDTPANCCTRYNYYKAKERVAELRDRVRAEAADIARRPPVSAATLPPAPEPPIVVAPPVAPPEPAKRPRYFHHTDMDIIARIERQGLTAGFLGDPPAGRSALDQRQGAK